MSGNSSGVGIQGDKIIVLFPKAKTTRDEAIDMSVQSDCSDYKKSVVIGERCEGCIHWIYMANPAGAAYYRCTLGHRRNTTGEYV